MQNKVKQIINILADKYPQPETALNYETPFELLIAVILSAQTTDKQVNKVTSKLFKEYNTPVDFSRLKRKDLEKKLNSLGLYRNKSKYIMETADIIKNNFSGQVPDTRQDLLKLPGVGNKTASVVLACAFAQATFPVDTHVFRVSSRLGLASGENVEQTEAELKEKIPRDKWKDMHHWLIYHGREICKARNPRCEKCKLQFLCQYYDQN